MLKKYDRMCAQIHFHIRKEVWVKLGNEHWYDQLLKSVETNHEGNVAIVWNQHVRTERNFPNSKSDIIICDNKQGTCTLICIANPGDRNVIKKEAERILKYKVLIIEIQFRCNVRSKVMPVIKRATETISKSLVQYLSK